LWLVAGSASAAGLAGTEWQPLRIGDVEVAENADVFLQFRSKGRLVGHGGCNRLMAGYQATGGAIFVGPVMATRMACAADVMAQEAALAAALRRVRTFDRQKTRLVLFDAQHQPVMELRQRDWD
jgi:putative lipoprotein